MKKLLVLMLAAGLFACGTTDNKKPGAEAEAEETETKAEVEEEKTVPVSDELDNQVEEPSEEETAEAKEKWKAEAVEGSFVELNAGEVSKETKIKLTGIAKFIQGSGNNQVFTLYTQEGDGFGVYQVKNYILEKVEEGSEVTVYGMYNGKSELGSPEIIAILIE